MQEALHLKSEEYDVNFRIFNSHLKDFDSFLKSNNFAWKQQKSDLKSYIEDSKIIFEDLTNTSSIFSNIINVIKGDIAELTI